MTDTHECVVVCVMSGCVSTADAVDTLVMREGETRYSEKEFAERFAVIQSKNEHQHGSTRLS